MSDRPLADALADPSAERSRQAARSLRWATVACWVKRLTLLAALVGWIVSLALTGGRLNIGGWVLPAVAAWLMIVTAAAAWTTMQTVRYRGHPMFWALLGGLLSVFDLFGVTLPILLGADRHARR